MGSKVVGMPGKTTNGLLEVLFMRGRTVFKMRSNSIVNECVFAKLRFFLTDQEWEECRFQIVGTRHDDNNIVGTIPYGGPILGQQAAPFAKVVTVAILLHTSIGNRAF